MMEDSGHVPEIADPVRVLMDQRDHLLRQAEALRNKVAGLDIAIAIVEKDIAQIATGGPA